MKNTSATIKPKNKVLFITYNFPPAGGVGRLRIVKFLKYLQEFGWAPQVLTVKKPFYPLVDHSLLKELPENLLVTRINYFEPGLWSQNRYWQSLLAYYLYPLFLLPDIRAFWIWPAVKKACEIVKNNHIKVIFTSSYSVSDHLVAYWVKRRTGVRWVADFRDEWSTNAYSKFPTPLHKWFARRWEKKVVSAADKVVTVSPLMTDYFVKITNNNKCLTIMNGFDSADFEEKISKTKRAFCQIVYAGTLFRNQKLDAFEQALKELNLPKIKVEFFGGKKRLPHQEIVKIMRQADILLFVLSAKEHPLYLTGKLFEYLASQRPILALANSNNAAAKLIKKLKVGEIAHPERVSEIKKAILNLYKKWEKNELTIPKIDLTPYNRRGTAKQLAQVFDAITPQPRRICLVVNGQSPQSAKLSAYLLKRNYEIHYINLTNTPLKLTGVKNYWIKQDNKYSWEPLKTLLAVVNKLRALIELKKLIRFIRPDIVHGHGLNFAGILTVLSGFKPVVVTTRGSDVMEIDKMIAPEQYLIRHTLKKADLVTGSSDALKNQSLKIGMPPEKFRMVYWGIDGEIFKNKNMEKLRKKLQIKPNQKVILYPRSIKAKYNIDAFLKAVATIKTDFKIVFIKFNLDPIYWAKMQPLIKELKLQDKIILLPATNPQGMADLYNVADVVVSLAEYDGLAVFFLEAMACEKKIVLADFGFVKEWYHNNNFWMVPIGDTKAATKAIESALAMPQAKFAPISRANRAQALERTEINKGFAMMEDVYRELV